MSERQIHWAVALPFMVCYVTAVVLIAVYNPHPERPWRMAFSWIHRASGISLCVLPSLILIRHWYDVAVHLDNIREVWRWTLADLKWLALTGPAMLCKSIILPEQGKFNAGEKINFMALTVTVPLYLVTGVMIWSHQFAFSAWVVHLTMAAAATPLLFGHLFMAVVNPDTRKGLTGMVTGFVDRQWASHHYGLWYRANFTAPMESVSDETPDALVAADTGQASGVTDTRPHPALGYLEMAADEPAWEALPTGHPDGDAEFDDLPVPLLTREEPTRARACDDALNTRLVSAFPDPMP